MRSFILLIITVAFQLSSCGHRQDTFKDVAILDEANDTITLTNQNDTIALTNQNDTIALTNQNQDISNEYSMEEGCSFSSNPYAKYIENDPSFFRKIENGDTDAFELYYCYTAYTYNREEIINVIKYSLLLAEKYHYSYGYNRVYESYVRLYEIDGSLSDADQKKLVSYCWKSYNTYRDIAAVYRLLSIFRGDLIPTLQDIDQYKYCDSIIKYWKEYKK